MNAGLLRENIRVHQLTQMVDQYGGDIQTYDAGKMTRARVTINKSDREYVANGEFFGEVITFQIRLYHKVNNTDRISWNGNQYRILSVFPDKVRQLIEIKTELIRE